jgi:hypothetical protein
LACGSGFDKYVAPPLAIATTNQIQKKSMKLRTVFDIWGPSRGLRLVQARKGVGELLFRA